MASYQTYTTVGDMGPWVSKLVLDLPSAVRAEDVTPTGFSVYVERMDLERGQVALAAEHHGMPLRPSRGYVPVRAAYPCSAASKPQPASDHVALELPEIRLTKRIDGDVMRGYIRGLEYRVTQTAALPATDPDDAPTVGLVWDDCAGDLCPQLDGWHLDGHGTYAGTELNFGWYEPNVAAVNAFRAQPGFFHDEPLPDKLPLVVWLHGAGEGQEPYRSVCGNKAVALGEPDIQGKLGGAAWVLVPSSPTFWMDPDGAGEIVDDNQSCYVAALKALIDAFVAAHADAIDRDRIYIGGLSNGGFMTCRMIADYPGFFAAAVPVCAPWVGELATADEYAAMARTPQWWVQVSDDPIVRPETHLKAAWPQLQAAGAKELHATYYDHIEDAEGKHLIGHFVWIQAYNDDPRTDLDGSLVRGADGFPVTLWQWVGQQRLA